LKNRKFLKKKAKLNKKNRVQVSYKNSQRNKLRPKIKKRKSHNKKNSQNYNKAKKLAFQKCMLR